MLPETRITVRQARLIGWQWRAVMLVGGALLLGLIIVLPFALAQNAWFEWANPYWFLTVDVESVRQTGLPARLVTSSASGAFYPQFVFYSGGAFAVLAYLGAVIGSWPAFTTALVLAVASGAIGAYAGARAVRLARLPSGALAIAGSTTPYMVTNIYGRGAWAEVLGVGSAWLMIGSGLWFLREGGHTLRGRLALATVTFSSAWLAMSHNISLLLGTAFAVAIWSVLACDVSCHARSAVRRIGALGIGYGIGLGLSAAWLVPNLWYSSDTLASSWRIVGTAAPFDRLSIVLSPWLRYPDDQRAITARAFGSPSQERLFNQTASLLLVIIGIGIAYRLLNTRRTPFAWTPRSLAAALGLGIIACLSLLVMTATSILANAPDVFQSVQFAYRLNPYLTFTLVILAALALRAMPRRAAWAAGGLVAMWYLGLAVYQTSTARPVAPPQTPIPRVATITADSPPSSFSAKTAAAHQFRFVPVAPVTAASGERILIDDDSGVAQEARARASTNIVCTPFVQSGPGARIVGTDASGMCVVSTRAGTKKLVTAAWPGPSIAGAAITGATLVGIIGLGAVGAARRGRDSP